jgi:hypothetical protein
VDKRYGIKGTLIDNTSGEFAPGVLEKAVEEFHNRGYKDIKLTHEEGRVLIEANTDLCIPEPVEHITTSFKLDDTTGKVGDILAFNIKTEEHVWATDEEIENNPDLYTFRFTE